jgi:hypothetical protein
MTTKANNAACDVADEFIAAACDLEIEAAVG